MWMTQNVLKSCFFIVIYRIFRCYTFITICYYFIDDFSEKMLEHANCLFIGVIDLCMLYDVGFV